MHAVLNGVSRDALMAKHKSNHIQVVYSNDAAAADRTLQTKAVFAQELGINVNLCGGMLESIVYNAMLLLLRTHRPTESY